MALIILPTPQTALGLISDYTCYFSLYEPSASFDDLHQAFELEGFVQEHVETATNCLDMCSF
jgi:hypothetical protein